MIFNRSHEHTPSFRINLLFACCIIGIISSCSVVKNPPRQVPYAWNNEVVLRAPELNADQRGLLKTKLLEYLDDSLKVQTISVLGRTRRINPPVFDSANIFRSIRFMSGYLNSLGYYRPVFDSFTVKKEVRPEKQEIRMSTTFFVSVGKSTRVDTLMYGFRNNLLQYIADSVKGQSQLLPNMLYSKEKVAAELDRLAALFRQQGFMRMNRSALLVEADTTDAVLLNPASTTAQLVAAAVTRLADPRISLRVMQRPGADTSAFARYVVDSVIVYPQASAARDAGEMIQDTLLKAIALAPGIYVKSGKNDYSQNLLRKNIFLKPGSLYNETAYFKTLNGFTQTGPWQQVDGRAYTRFDSVPLASYHVLLYPARKQSFQVDLEGSQNNNISVSNALAGRFLALALNATHRNRNIFRSGTQSTTTGTVGFELNNTQSSVSPNFFQTFIAYFSQRYSIPGLLKPFKAVGQRGNIDVGRTNINLNASYTERFRFFKQTSVNTSLQWEWRKGRNSTTFSLPNFETVFLDPVKDSLDKVIAQNPALRFAFTPGNILSTRLALERNLAYRKARNFGFYRLSGELALPPGFRLFNNDFFSFFLVQGQYVQGIRFPAASLHYRFYAGAGWDISGKKDATLPFFRQFVAGGSNSMRAWPLRQLGLGRSLVSDTASFTDRFGDMQLEANVEHRFRMFRFFGYAMNGAVFMDIGNIWNHKNNIDGSGKLTLGNLYRDLAIGTGFGIRWDLDYFVIRLDAAYKLKDPVREGAGWLGEFTWKGDNRMGGYERNNVALQFGIGYPF